MNVQSSRKWWSTLKSVVFSTSSSLNMLVSEDDGLGCDFVGKADLLLDHLDSKLSREAVDLPLTCHPVPSLTTFAFRSREVRTWTLMVALTHSTTQFAYRKGLCTCDALLCVSHTLQSALESAKEARKMQIDFSAAFDRVNHPGISL